MDLEVARDLLRRAAPYLITGAVVLGAIATTYAAQAEEERRAERRRGGA